jgi:hypothetical protein
MAASMGLQCHRKKHCHMSELWTMIGGMTLRWMQNVLSQIYNIPPYPPILVVIGYRYCQGL